MKFAKTLALVALVSLLVPTSAFSEDAITSKTEGIRVLVATSRRFISQTKLPQTDKVEALAAVRTKQEKIICSLDMAIAGGKVPNFKELRKLRRWLDRFYEVGTEAKIYKVGTREDAAFALNTSLAVTYMDCAFHLAFSLR